MTTKQRKEVYFLSDAHLGSRAIKHQRTHERRLVNFLDSIKNKAQTIYLMGDMFDFWYEFKTVVPRGFTRFLGKLSELTDMGVEVHFFVGNHDLWTLDYLEKECGVQLHYKPEVVDIMGKMFYLAHGDGLNEPSKLVRFMNAGFRSPILRWLFSAVHPRWSLELGLTWAKHSRMKHCDEDGVYRGGKYKGEKNEFLVTYSKEYLKNHPMINFFIYGHRHVLLDLMITREARVLILGDWMYYFSYAKFDGETMILDQYVEGLSKV